MLSLLYYSVYIESCVYLCAYVCVCVCKNMILYIESYIQREKYLYNAFEKCKEEISLYTNIVINRSNVL